MTDKGDDHGGPSSSVPGSSSSSSPADSESADKLNSLLFNMSLAHEVKLTDNLENIFSDTNLPQIVEQDRYSQLVAKVSDIVHRAYWDTISEKLSGPTPSLGVAVSLISDIKQSLKDVLFPHQTRLMNEIDRFLDIDLMRQQIAHNAFNYKEYTDGIIQFMSRLCAPVRDSDVQALRNTTDLVPLLRGILETLQKMKLDIIKYSFSMIKSEIVKPNYERTCFQKYLAMTKGNLENTKKWLEPYKPSSKVKSDIDNALAEAFIDLIVKDIIWYQKREPGPETLFLDTQRILKLKTEFYQIASAVSVILITLNTLGATLSENEAFIKRLKGYALGFGGCLKTDNKCANERLGVLSSDIIHLVEDMSPDNIENSIKTQFKDFLIELVDPDHRVVVVVIQRLKEYFTESAYTQNLPTVPSALFFCSDEVQQLVQAFKKVFFNNIRVYYPFYEEILTSEN